MKPYFQFLPQQVQLLETPSDFHQWLIDEIGRAQHRVVLASLYIGTDRHSAAVVEALHKRHQQHAALRSHILLDYLRGTRGLRQASSSLNTLQPVLPFTTLSLYHTPFLTKWHKMILSERWNEIMGLQHMKIYVVDDKVLLSGANLSDTYFTNRQDRYIVFNDHKSFADYCAQIVTHVGYKLSHTRPPSLLYEADPLAQFQPPHPQARFQEPTIACKAAISEEAKNMIRVTPFSELPPLKIHQETTLFDQGFLREWRTQCSRLYLCSGYLNLRNTLQAALCKQTAAMTFLCAHPTANGFFGAKGPSKWIPDMYRQYSLQIKSFLPSSQVLEWQRERWTFHGKGIWLYDQQNQPRALTIGSSNFNPRSTRRDLEFSVLLEIPPTPATVQATPADPNGMEAFQHRVDTNRRALFAHGSALDVSKSSPFWKRASLDLLSRIVRSFF